MRGHVAGDEVDDADEESHCDERRGVAGPEAEEQPVISRVNANAPMPPMMRPSAVRIRGLPPNIRTTASARAPIATRIPMSGRVCATVWKMTP
jgi:hypothetical protein